jgi:hypothetical protein
MKRKAPLSAAIAIAITAIVAGVTAAFGLDFDVDSPRQVVRLDAGERVLINCPARSLLTIQPSKEAPAAILKCADGGPGVTLLQP